MKCKCITDVFGLKEALAFNSQPVLSLDGRYVKLLTALDTIDKFTNISDINNIDTITSSIIDRFKQEEIVRNMEIQLKIQETVISECIKAQLDDPTAQAIKYDSVLSFARYMLSLNTALLMSLDYYQNKVDYTKEHDMIVKHFMSQKKG